MAKLNFNKRTGEESTALVDEKNRQQIVLTPGETPKNNRVEIVSSGVAVCFSAPNNYVDTITIKASQDNDNRVWIGSSGVSCGYGIELDPGDAVSLDIDNLRKLYVVGTRNKDCVTYLGMNVSSIDDF